MEKLEVQRINAYCLQNESGRSAMLYVYMTNCSLIRAYNQMTNARRDGVNSTGTPCSVEWLDGIADKPSRAIQTTKNDNPRDTK